MEFYVRRAAVASVGCKVNQYDAGTVVSAFEDAGYEIVGFSDKADVYVVNTCAVTGEAAKKSKALVRRAVSAKLRHNNPQAIVVVAGCWSQVEAEEALAVEGVSAVFGTKDYDGIVQIVEDKLKEGIGENYDDKVSRTIKPIIKTKNGMTRAYLKIEDGCDNFCSYCVIPYARGSVKSRPLSSIVREAEQITEKGVKEIVLTGIHVASYGKDLDTNAGLSDVCRAVNGVNGLKRLRLSSLSPMAVTGEFVQSIKSLDAICDYFHLSLQSGSKNVLDRMGRGYAPSDYFNAVKLLRKAFPDCAVWSDIIAGFPGETDAEFEESLAFIEKSGINNLHVFPFSPKKGTAAYNMGGQVSGAVKAERARTLARLSGKLYGSFLSERTGIEYDVLFELKKDGFYMGHTSNYILVKALSDVNVNNQIVRVRLVEIEKKKSGFEALGMILAD